MWARFCGTAFRRGFQMMSDVGQRQRGVCLCGETGPMARPRRGGVRHRDCGRVRRRTVPVLNGSAVRLYLSVLVREKDRAMRRQTGTRRAGDRTSTLCAVVLFLCSTPPSRTAHSRPHSLSSSSTRARATERTRSLEVARVPCRLSRPSVHVASIFHDPSDSLFGSKKTN